MTYGHDSNLLDLIHLLEQEDPTTIIKEGFDEEYSYRGYYQDLGVQSARNVSIQTMLTILKRAVDNTYEGWKGGDFTMGKYTDVFLTPGPGDTGIELSQKLFGYMLKDVVK